MGTAVGTAVRPPRGPSITCLLEDRRVRRPGLHVIAISELESLRPEKQDGDALWSCG